MAAKARQSYLVLLQIILKVIYEYFHSIKHFHVHKFIDFCDERDSHIYDNGQLLKNSNLWNSQTKHCFQPKHSENMYTTEF